jgi:ral guanine nucleotide dissociation stimulator-like 1
MDLAWFVTKEDSLQFFKEERIEGAVYNVYLKKVRYHTFDDTVDDDVTAKVSHLQWRTLEIRVIKSGTIERLVENLSCETGEIDSTYVNVFLSTFRAFAKTKQVLTLLLDRYVHIGENSDMKQQDKEGHRKTMRIVMSVWLDGYPEDFRESPHYPSLKQLMKFAERHLEGGDLAHRVQHRIDKFTKEEESQIISVEDIEFHFSLLDEVNIMSDNLMSKLTRPVEFENIPERIFAEQLTFMDSELFKKVIPHHCLGSIWSRRDKKGLHAPSVYATVNQFNAVSYRVIATVLKHPMDIHRPERAQIIEKWIEIAQNLRILKNFSSLKAIISGLQSNPVYRLHKVWNDVDRDSLIQFHELAEIFSEDNNQMMARELLMKEGTAKHADMENNTISRRRRSAGGTYRTRSPTDLGMTVQGTVPYLGTFLTDLTMIDTAINDRTEDELINFDKRRKEFELLAQIRLLQSAATLYSLKPDGAFLEWFHSIRVYDDKESYDLSCEIEPVTPSTPKEVKGHRKKSSLGFFTPRRPVSISDELSLSSYSDDTASDNYSAPVTPDNQSNQSSLKPPSLRHSLSMTSLKSSEDLAMSPWKSPETCVVKVSLETSDSPDTNHYKSVLLSNSDHTKRVIHNILLKFDQEGGKPEDYVIFQTLPENKELTIPDKGNVFYAINTNVPDIRFIVRKKSDLERIKAKQKKKKAQHNKKYTL